MQYAEYIASSLILILTCGEVKMEKTILTDRLELTLIDRADDDLAKDLHVLRTDPDATAWRYEKSDSNPIASWKEMANIVFSSMIEQ